jgi:hypothetical protein
MGVKSRPFSVLSSQFKRRLALLLGMVGLVAGCSALGRPIEIRRIALLAPFEERYREIGYDAYYAVKLAMQDMGDTSIELVAVDDGGTRDSAVDRAYALTSDPLVQVVIALGNAATQPETQAALGDKPMLIVGQWGASPEGNHVFTLASQAVSAMVTDDPALNDVIQTARLDFPIVGNEVLALKQFPLLHTHPERVTVVSSGSFPDTDFKARYEASAEFVPEPGLLTTLTYDATRIALQAIYADSDTRDALAKTDYTGLNGRIQFHDGYWLDAPIHCYGYSREGELTPKDCPVE